MNYYLIAEIYLITNALNFEKLASKMANRLSKKAKLLFEKARSCNSVVGRFSFHNAPSLSEKPKTDSLVGEGRVAEILIEMVV